MAFFWKNKFFPLHDGVFHFLIRLSFHILRIKLCIFFKSAALAVWKVLVENFIWYRPQVVVSRGLANTGDQFNRDNPQIRSQFKIIEGTIFQIFEHLQLWSFTVSQTHNCKWHKHYLKRCEKRFLIRKMFRRSDNM